MKTRFVILLFVVATSVGGAASLLVENGQPRAEIVIAKEPPRTVLLAADELRDCVAKISGAELPIVTRPGGAAVQLYVGRSAHADRLGVTGEGLKYGAYRIVSGDNWMVFIGDDTDFVPIEPWPRSHNDLVSGKMQTAWNGITGHTWGYPLSQLRKHYTGATGLFGTEREQHRDKNGDVNVWGFDERGSFNAVCGFLRQLGVRWYFPGELGEVVPRLASIPLPKIDETGKPDFEVRRFNVRFGTASRDTAMWAARLGMRDPYGLRVAHGMHKMTQAEVILKEHPEWFALYGGKRQNQPGERLNHLCYSNPELFEETVRWARAQFDHFKFSTVSVMPPDAYISICQCPLCAGKDEPERGSRGKLSNHVWDFVNRVAKEVGKTHPDKQIVCCAYGANTEPPTNIDKLEPNVQVIIVGGRRPRANLPEQQADIRRLREGWDAKTDNPLMVFENYPITDRGWYLPAFVARTIGESVNATKGISRGEDIWLSFGPRFDRKDLGFNHFQVYFTARMYWGGPDQDVGAMLDEYCRLFYGPAGDAMKSFFDYCEANWQEMDEDKEKVEGALGRFASAKASVAAGSVYAKRLAVMDEFLESLRSKGELLGQKRGPVTKLRTVWDPKEIVVDGKLDEEYWVDCPVSATGRLRELQTGRLPVYGTTIKSGWKGGSVYFAIRCDEAPGERLNIATKKNEDQSIWYGDAVEILLETDMHSYYQLAVNPAGALVDLDRGADKSAWFRWQSQAEVATQVADDHWTIEIRIPVTNDENDPLNQVIGSKPIQSLPWHFNICRQRIRDNGTEYSAFSPTGTGSFHERMKFAHFYDGRSHQFDVDPTVTDFLIAYRAAEKLSRSRKYAEALKIFVELAGGKVTEFQKSAALEKAAACARGLKDYKRAGGLADAIPMDSVAQTVRMENLYAQRQWKELVEQFGGEDFGTWPFWQAGAGYALRGRAHANANLGEKAESDLQAALPLIADSRVRMSLLNTIGHNREENLKDDDRALAAYREIVDSKHNTSGAEYLYGVQGTVRVLTRQGRFDDALQILDRVKPDRLKGSWRGSMLLSRAQTLAAAGRMAEARKAYEAVLADKSAHAGHKSLAESALKEL